MCEAGVAVAAAVALGAAVAVVCVRWLLRLSAIFAAVLCGEPNSDIACVAL